MSGGSAVNRSRGDSIFAKERGRSPPGSRVSVKASARRMRLFCGLRLSALTKPASRSAFRSAARPLPARVACTTTVPPRAAARQRIRFPPASSRPARSRRRRGRARARGDERVHRRAVAAGIGVDDVDARQRVKAADVEGGVGRMTAHRRAVIDDLRAIDLAEGCRKSGDPERLQARRRRLRNLARRLDLVVERDEHAPARRRRGWRRCGSRSRG